MNPGLGGGGIFYGL